MQFLSSEDKELIENLQEEIYRLEQEKRELESYYKYEHPKTNRNLEYVGSDIYEGIEVTNQRKYEELERRIEKLREQISYIQGRQEREDKEKIEKYNSAWHEAYERYTNLSFFRRAALKMTGKSFNRMFNKTENPLTTEQVEELYNGKKRSV